MNNWFSRQIDRLQRLWQYAAHGVWADTRPKFSVNLVKTLNIVVKSFLSADIQTQACAMTYRTLLALVPALALIFAIGRGFGFQNLLQDELYHIFPSQHDAITHALAFVDSYLNQASEGIFVGVGVAFLLYTIINLVSNVETAFNLVWNIKEGRSIWRKITDYTAMLLILPILMICAGGFSMSLSNTIQQFMHFSFFTPIITMLFECLSFFFTCLFFTAMFMMIPNTKVRFQNALIAGLFTGVGFTILQWLFVTGQLYVARYNAIYGSFSFLPLLLLWMQLVWVIILSGALICYASQNIFQFSFSDQINDIAPAYKEKVTLAIAATIVQRFARQEAPLQLYQLVATYGIPSRLASNIVDRLTRAGIISRVLIDEQRHVVGYQPAIDVDTLTVGFLRERLTTLGYSNFIPQFDQRFPGVDAVIAKTASEFMPTLDSIHLKDIEITKDPAKLAQPTKL